MPFENWSLGEKKLKLSKYFLNEQVRKSTSITIRFYECREFVKKCSGYLK